MNSYRLNTDSLQKKLVEDGALDRKEAQLVLNELEHYKRVAGYLASCHAATLESLPKSASKSSRKRMMDICTIAADALDRNPSSAGSRVAYSVGNVSVDDMLDWNAKRCRGAVARKGAE